MNTYYKYAPNAWLAECAQEHAHGERIQITNKFGKDADCTVWKLVMIGKNGKFYYSFLRDGDAYAARKLARYESAADKARTVADSAWAASNEGADFLALGEPIKIGHHSEKRHRALIERNHRRMGKGVEYYKKADEYSRKAEYWRSKLGEITLAMPQSVDHFAKKLAKLEAIHAGMKAGTIARNHCMSMQYALRDVKEARKQLEIAKKLWEITG
jgi:hypothetical protein